MRYLVGDPFIDDICFYNKKNPNEQLPEHYFEMDVAGVSQVVRHSASVSVALHGRDGVGICDLSYETATTDRYPKEVGACCICLYSDSISCPCIPLRLLSSTRKTFTGTLVEQKITYYIVISTKYCQSNNLYLCIKIIGSSPHHSLIH